MKPVINKISKATRLTILADTNKLKLLLLTIAAIIINQVLFPFVSVDIKMLQQFTKWQFLKVALLQLIHS